MTIIAVAFLEAREDDAAITVDHGEQIIEVVGHAAGESPDGLHFLRLPELLLHLLHLREVDQHVDGPDDLARRVAEQFRMRQNIGPGTIGALDDDFFAANGTAFPQRPGDGRLVERQQSAIRLEKLDDFEPTVVVDFGLASPKLDGVIVEKRQPPCFSLLMWVPRRGKFH